MGNGVWTVEIIPAEIEPPHHTVTSTSGNIIRFGTEKVTGVNVIARNVADPYYDAVSAISSDFTDDFSQAKIDASVAELAAERDAVKELGLI